jgi:hypothetical protein
VIGGNPVNSSLKKMFATAAVAPATWMNNPNGVLE